MSYDNEAKPQKILEPVKILSASTRQTYLAELPDGYQGQFGPGMRALVITLYYEMTEPKIILLIVLHHPEIPLHNNPAELAAKRRVRKQDVSFGPRTANGVKAWDTFMTLAATTKKLGISFFAYVYNRMAGVNALPRLAHLIEQRSPTSHPVIATPGV